MADYASNVIEALRRRTPLGMDPTANNVTLLSNPVVSYLPPQARPARAAASVFSPPVLLMPKVEPAPRATTPSITPGKNQRRDLPLQEPNIGESNGGEGEGYGGSSAGSMTTEQAMNAINVGAGLSNYGSTLVAPGALVAGVIGDAMMNAGQKSLSSLDEAMIGNSVTAAEMDAAQAMSDYLESGAANLGGPTGLYGVDQAYMDSGTQGASYGGTPSVVDSSVMDFGTQGESYGNGGGPSVAEALAIADAVGMSGFDNTGNVGSEGGGGGGGKIICTKLHEMGLMPTHIFEADQKFGQQMAMHNPLAMTGYHALARPVVDLMSKPGSVGKVVTKLAYWIATPWAKEMARRMGVHERKTMVGWMLMEGGVRLCSIVGRLVQRRHAFSY